jgi:hypothetical protein
MRTFKLLLLAAALGCAATANAVTITRDAAAYAVGADVTNAWPGVTLTRLRNVPGATTYAPTVSPAIIMQCTTFGACPVMGTQRTIGDRAYNVFHYRDCYNANQNGLPSGECGMPFDVLSAQFAVPTDFVEFTATWGFDAPMMIAYDTAGNQIAQCFTGLPGGCTSVINFNSVDKGFGTIRITASSNVIARVVVGTPSGSSMITGIQYNARNRDCLPPRH